MTYITSEELKSALELTGTTFADSEVDRAIDAAKKAIDDYCHRTFDEVAADATATARRYTANRGDLLYIDDARAVTEVAQDTDRDGTFNETWTEGAGDDYELEPYNAAADSEPFTKIVAIRKRFVSHRGGVRVTGRFGWPQTPASVKQAAAMLSAKLLQRSREAPLGIAAFGVEGGTAMRMILTDPDVKDLLNPLVRNRYPSS